MESMSFIYYNSSNPTEKKEIDFVTLTEFIRWCTTRGCDVIVHSGRKLEVNDLD